LKERKDKEILTASKYNQEFEKWKGDLKKLMPLNYRYKALPMFFSFNEAERIKSSVVKQASQFFMVLVLVSNIK
jgi:hypothetical protein